ILRLPTSTPLPYTTLFRSQFAAPFPLLHQGALSFLPFTIIVEELRHIPADHFGGSPAVEPLGAFIPEQDSIFEIADKNRVLCFRSEEHTSELQSQSNLVCR